MNNNLNPIEIIKSLHNKKITTQLINVYGYQFTYQHLLITSVSKYFYSPNTIVESIIDKEHNNRPGLLKPSIEYITVHDTGSSGIGANEHAHRNYVTNPETPTSWHYTCGSEIVYHHVPDEEVAWHAGDNRRIYHLNDTFIKAEDKDVEITISEDGFYNINGKKTNITVPTIDNRILNNSDITPSGIRLIVGDNGNYFIGDTYYNSTYKVIANQGGNINSIGIESAIDKGSDIYRTWQRLAKLVSWLLIKHNLKIEDVKQHNFFSGKNCPQTMREASMWEHFIDLVKGEYLVATTLKDYTITLTSNNPDLVDNTGRVIKLPKKDTDVSYTVNIKKDDYNETITLTVTIPSSSL